MPVGCAAVLVVAIAAAVVGSLFEGTDERREAAASAEPPEPQAAPDAVALLDGLRVGSPAGPWSVAAIRPPKEKRLPILFIGDGASLTVWVERKESTKRHPPAQTERYAIFYSSVFPPDAAGAKNSPREALAEIEKRLRKTEIKVPVPDGL